MKRSKSKVLNAVLNGKQKLNVGENLLDRLPYRPTACSALTAAPITRVSLSSCTISSE